MLLTKVLTLQAGQTVSVKVDFLWLERFGLAPDSRVFHLTKVMDTREENPRGLSDSELGLWLIEGR